MKPICRFAAVLLLASAATATAQQFLGTNAPGGGTDFSFTVGAGATNLSIVVTNSTGAWSYLRMKKGGTPTDTDYDYGSRVDGVNNRISLEGPEFASGSYGLRVSTPTNSGEHAFAAVLSTNRSDLRSAGAPAVKPVAFSTTGVFPSGTAGGTWQYFQVDIPTNPPSGWRVVLSQGSGDGPDLYVRRGTLPTESYFDRASLGKPLDTVFLTGTDAANSTWFIGIRLPADAATAVSYTLSAETDGLRTLAWDPGTTHLGTEVFTNQSTLGGDYYFAVTTVGTLNGIWRTALNVQSGEANVYLQYGVLPTESSYLYGSARVGSDGFVLSQAVNQFAASQQWYLLVHATPGAQWTLVTGEAYVMPLPDLAADASSGATVTMGAEGMRFFKTRISASTLAWRLQAGGLTNQVLVKKTAAPHPAALGYSYDWTAQGQMLLVAPYLNIGDEYYVGVVGDPGLSFTLDSRQQPVADLAFGASTNFSVTGFRYATFRVEVPVEQIAWQVNVQPSAGNADVAVRRGAMPNEFSNDAYSDVGGSAGDSVTLVPPGLSDGTFFITVYGGAPFTCSLTQGQPVITDVDYVFHITNDVPNRVGWRYYRVKDKAQQLGTLGWDLLLANQPVGTEIALRRSAVPGRWNLRTMSSWSWSEGTAGYVDYSGSAGYLQRPAHQADVWYVGVYSPASALGPFVLSGQQLGGNTIGSDGGSGVVGISNQPAGRWQVFRVEPPTNALGWDIRLANVTSGRPQLVMRRDQLPVDLTTSWWGAGPYAWPSGYQLAAGGDLTARPYDPSGATNEDGRILQLGIGNPVEPGTYYIGVLNAYGQSNAMSYTLQLRAIGLSGSIPVSSLPFNGGSVSLSGLAPRQAAYYQVTIPSNAPCWRLKLAATTGESMVCWRQDFLPNAFGNGLRLQKTGDEVLLALPDYPQTNLAAGTYYLAVAGEGANPTNSNSIGLGSSSFTLTTSNALGTISLGTLDPTGAVDLTRTDSQEGGVIKTFQFTVPAGALAFEATLENRVGRPLIFLRADEQLGFPPYWSSLCDNYGRSGSWGATWEAEQRILVPNPAAGLYTLVVQAAGYGYPAVWSNASYGIRIHALVAQPVAFAGGSATVVGQTADVEKYFRITVPSDALGWDLRLTNVTGAPVLTVCRDLAPSVEGSSGVSATGADWPSGAQWQANEDWTGCPLGPTATTYDNKRRLTVGMGNPLVPGTYYVRVRNDRNPWILDTMSYTLVSEGIGTNYSIGIQDLAFTNGTVSFSGLAPRDWRLYRVTVPTNLPSWKLRLTNQSGDTTLAIRQGGIPNNGAVYAGDPYWSGVLQRKVGDEQLLVMPPSGQTNVVAGTYYFAVTAQGENPQPDGRLGTNTSAFTLTSLGVAPVLDAGTVDVTGLSDLVYSNSQVGAESKAIQFTVPPGVLSLEVRLQDIVGKPELALRADSQLPVNYDYSGGSYGQLWGQPYTWYTSAYSGDRLLTLANPVPGTYTVMFKATATAQYTFPDASYTLRLRAVGAAPLSFSGGWFSVTNQPAGTWRYFVVQVPTNTMGWDLRLTNVTSGAPCLVVRRDQTPSGRDAVGWPWTGWGDQTNWASGNQILVQQDWTGYDYGLDGRILGGQELVTSMGNPLEPGTYYIGVISSFDYGYGIDPMSYTIISRGIGTNQIIPVGELAFTNGLVSIPDLPVREAAYYRIVVPSNAPSWKLRLATATGDSQLVLRQNGLPNNGTWNNWMYGGCKFRQIGNEHFLWLPSAGQTNIPGGTYYLAVLSEGLNPGGTIGTGSITCSLSSSAGFAFENLGTLGSSDLTSTVTMEGGEIRAHQFTIPPGALAVEVRLDDPVGLPRCSMVIGDHVSHAYAPYGLFGGVDYGWYIYTLVTLPNPTPGLYTCSVQGAGNGYPNTAYKLVVHPLFATQLNFAANLNTNGLSNTASGALGDDQRAFYKVIVPASNNGAPVLGWKLQLEATFGSPQMRVAKDQAPTDNNGTAFVTGTAHVVPEVLSPGTWYVEVRGVGGSAYTLTSTELTLKRPAWNMPAAGQPVTTPGLPSGGSLFGDTGVAPNGVPLPDDQGTDLGAGDMDYYVINVPSNNVGLLRTRLDALSGNPNLYIRQNRAPTFSPYAAYERFLDGSAGSEYGNWVSMNGRYEAYLTPGTWYLGVFAAGGSNVRYRVLLSNGDIQNLALNGGSFSEQTLAAGDWRYYRVQMPTNAPVNWSVTFNQSVGSVAMYVRDTTPPGNGQTPPYGGYDWGSDSKNHGPYYFPNYSYFDSPGTYTFSTPPLRPGATYYLGFRAVSDATFSVSSAVSGSTIGVTNTLSFYGGSFSSEIPAFGRLQYRIDVPADARRWVHVATHPESVWLHLDQGSVPTVTTVDHWCSCSQANGMLNLPLFTPNGWPWLPGYSYFLTLTNRSAQPQAVSFTMSGFGPGSPPSSFTSISLLPNGWLQFNLQVNPGWYYDLMTSTNLVDWTPSVYFMSTSNTFIYPSTLNYPQLFYRLRAQ